MGKSKLLNKTESPSGGSFKMTRPPSGDGCVTPLGDASAHCSADPIPPGPSRSQKRSYRKKLLKMVSKTSIPGTGESAGGMKRPLSDLSTPSPVQQRKKIRDNLPGSYASSVSVVRVAIVKEGFPSLRLQTEDVHTINMKILEAVDATPDGAPLPDIHGSKLNSLGAMVISCKDDATAGWVKTHFHGNNQIVRESALKVIPASELPKPVKVSFKTKDIYTEDAGVLLKRLQRFNPELKSGGWRTLNREVDSQFTRWVFEVDIESAAAIKKANLQASTGIDKGVFGIIKDPNDKSHQPAPPGRRTSASTDASIEHALNELAMETGSESTTICPGDEDNQSLPDSPAGSADDCEEGDSDPSREPLKTKEKKTVTYNEDELVDSDAEDEPDAYLQRVKAEGEERERGGGSTDEESSDESFAPEESGSEVAEEYDSNPPTSSDSDDEEGSGSDSGEEQKALKPKKPKEPKKSKSAKTVKEPGTRKKRQKKEKDENKPKRAPSAYFLYLAEVREQIKRDNPGISITEITKKAGEMWKEVSDKSKWEEKAAELKKEYEKKMAEYKASGGGAEKKKAKEPKEKSSKKEKEKKSSPVKSPTKSPGSFKSKEYISSDSSSSDSEDKPLKSMKKDSDSDDDKMEIDDASASGKESGSESG